MLSRRRRPITRIFKNRWFEHFARRERLSDAVLVEAVDRADSGLVDADLGGGVIKQRVARPGEGRTGGYRALILFRSGDRALFVFGFAKSARANIGRLQLAALKKAANEMLNSREARLIEMVKDGELKEIERGANGQG